MTNINQKRNKYLTDAMDLKILLKGKPINKDTSIKIKKKQEELWDRYNFFKNFQIAEGKITYRLLTEEEIEMQEALHAEEQSKLIEE